ELPERRAVALLELLARPARTRVVPPDGGPVDRRRRAFGRLAERAGTAGTDDHRVALRRRAPFGRGRFRRTDVEHFLDARGGGRDLIRDDVLQHAERVVALRRRRTNRLRRNVAV